MTEPSPSSTPPRTPLAASPVTGSTDAPPNSDAPPAGDDPTRVWRESEADAWFRRNEATLNAWTPEGDPLVRMIRRYGLEPRSVLEVGCSNGFRVAHLAGWAGQDGAVGGDGSEPPDTESRRFPFLGVDPSAAAIADGSRRYPGIRLLEGVAHALPVERAFQLVMVNYVMTWIPRPLLLRSIAELDRCLEDGGYLLLGDFLPPVPTRVPYHHLPDAGMYTWKQDYGRLFEGTGIYRLVARLEMDHGTNRPLPEIPPGNRGAVWLLQKDLMEGYQEAPGR